MPTYDITVSIDIQVEADSEDQAIQLAKAEWKDHSPMGVEVTYVAETD